MRQYDCAVCLGNQEKSRSLKWDTFKWEFVPALFFIVIAYVSTECWALKREYKACHLSPQTHRERQFGRELCMYTVHITYALRKKVVVPGHGIGVGEGCIWVCGGGKWGNRGGGAARTPGIMSKTIYPFWLTMNPQRIDFRKRKDMEKKSKRTPGLKKILQTIPQMLQIDTSLTELDLHSFGLSGLVCLMNLEFEWLEAWENSKVHGSWPCPICPTVLYPEYATCIPCLTSEGTELVTPAKLHFAMRKSRPAGGEGRTYQGHVASCGRVSDRTCVP